MINKESITRGFVTIATGDDHYYQIAVNLLNSYKTFTKSPLPFAIISDKENRYTDLFDETIIIKHPYFSYLDKIQLLGMIPYDETVFVESDCIAYADMNLYFDAFENADDFSAFGYSIPIDENQCGWFKLEETGKYLNRIKHYQLFHSGVLFLRKTETCKTMLNICNNILEHYDDYNIGGNNDMLDDKLFAVASAATHCRMTPNCTRDYDAFCVFPHVRRNQKFIKPAIIKGTIIWKDDANVLKKGIICHWGNAATKKHYYKREIIGLSYLMNKYKLDYIKYYLYYPFVSLDIIKDKIISFYWRIVRTPVGSKLIKYLVLLKRKLKSILSCKL